MKEDNELNAGWTSSLVTKGNDVVLLTTQVLLHLTKSPSLRNSEIL